MRQYELTYLISDEVAENDLKKISDQVAGFVVDAGGKIEKDESWGRRKLAYPIKKQNFATYITIWFEIAGDKIAEVDHELKVLPAVIRHLITLKVAEPESLKVSKEDIAGAEEVKDILGGRSFEIVEGESAESRDLQAVREKEAKEELEDKEKTEVEKPKLARKTKIVEEPAEEIKEKPKRTAKPKKVKTEVKSEKPKIDKAAKDESEAERIKKLDEKLDELLKDDL